MSANNRTRTTDRAASTVEAVLGESEVIVVSNREPYGHGYDGGSVADATGRIERLFEPIATDPREDSLASEDACGD